MASLLLPLICICMLVRTFVVALVDLAGQDNREKRTVFCCGAGQQEKEKADGSDCSKRIFSGWGKLALFSLSSHPSVQALLLAKHLLHKKFH